MIVLQDLWFGYRRDEAIINGISHRFPQGKVTAVSGPSGRGKSTLLYLIGLLLSPWQGTLTIGGMQVSHMPDRVRSSIRAERIGFVFQDAALDASRSVLENVIEGSIYGHIPRQDAMARARELLDRFGVSLRADHKPGEVSGGQAQRVALCRALLTDPDIVLADEPTGNLDPTAARLVVDTLIELAHGDAKTVVIATHDPSIINKCDQVVEL